MVPHRDDLELPESAPRLRDEGPPVDLEPLLRRLSDAAADLDAAESIPSDHFAAIAAARLYGVFAPTALGGLGLDLDETCLVIEELASACLATTFVWIQHFRLLGALLDPATPEELRALLPRVVSGEIKGGVALGGLLPGPARLRAERTDEGWRLDGEAPWVSGRGMVERLFVTARTADEHVVSLLIDAADRPGLEATPVRLAAVNASSTVRLHFRGLTVDERDCFGQQPYQPQREAPEGLRANGSLALGVARRCCELLGPSPLDAELRRARDELARASVDTVARARARASLLATRAARRLTIQRGSRAALAGDVAERSNREAAFLLVFGSRPSIKDAMVAFEEADGGPSAS